MAERRRGKQRKREEQPEKPTKEEYAVAKYLRFNLPTREGKLVGMSVQCFIASKAVDLLLESKWGTKCKKDPLFSSRAGCVDFCNNLLMKGLFHRAARVGKKKEKERDVARKKKKLKEGEEEVKETKEEKAKQEKKSKKKEKKKEKDDDEEAEKEKESEGEKEEKKTEEKKDEERKKKRKLRLEMHDLQIFKDGDEIYVWIYDPVPFKTFLIGLLLVLGAIAVCMFPLWPPEVRLGIYYLSLAAAGFVGVILALCVIRLVLFCLVWGVTLGRHHFWFLPNLTEDVGFFDSFKPLYKHEYNGGCSDTKAEENNAVKEDEEEGKGETKAEGAEGKEGDQEEEERGSEKEGSGDGSEDNGYEIVEREELLEKEEEEREEGEEEEGVEENREEEVEEEPSEHEHESKKTK